MLLSHVAHRCCRLNMRALWHIVLFLNAAFALHYSWLMSGHDVPHWACDEMWWWWWCPGLVWGWTGWVRRSSSVTRSQPCQDIKCCIIYWRIFRNYDENGKFYPGWCGDFSSQKATPCDAVLELNTVGFPFLLFFLFYLFTLRSYFWLQDNWNVSFIKQL